MKFCISYFYSGRWCILKDRCLSLQILADAMGLGKTVMTIALILSDSRGDASSYIERDTRGLRDCATRARTSRFSVRGGTLIVCPMALLGQWKVSTFF
jgi:DNA repair protein RAD5